MSGAWVTARRRPAGTADEPCHAAASCGRGRTAAGLSGRRGPAPGGTPARAASALRAGRADDVAGRRPLAQRAHGLQLDRDDRLLVLEVGLADVLGEELREDELAPATVRDDPRERADLDTRQRVGQQVVDGPELVRDADAQADLGVTGVDEPIVPVRLDRPREAGRPARELGGDR